jgi:hypothetical protein
MRPVVRAQAAAARSQGWTLDAIGDVLGVSRTRVAQILAKAARLAARPRWHDGFPVRALNFLRIRHLDALPETEAARTVARFTHKELKAIPNLGKHAIGPLCAWLERHGLALRELNAERDDTPIIDKETDDHDGRPNAVGNDPFAAGHRQVESTCQVQRMTT